MASGLDTEEGFAARVHSHQADLCHAYQLLARNGFSDERIITFFYDDIGRSV